MKSGKDDHTQKLHDALKKEIEELRLLSGNIASLDEDDLKLIKAARLTVGDGVEYANELDAMLNRDKFRTENFSSILSAPDLGTLLVNNEYVKEGSEIKTKYDEYVEQVNKVDSTFPSATSRNNQLSPIISVSTEKEQNNLTDQGERVRTIRQEPDEETERSLTESKEYNAEKEAESLTDSIEEKEEEKELKEDEKRIIAHDGFPVLELQTLSEIHKPEEAAARKIQRVYRKDSEKTRLAKLMEGLVDLDKKYSAELENKEEALKAALCDKATEIIESIPDKKKVLLDLDKQLETVQNIKPTKAPKVESIEKIFTNKSQPKVDKSTKGAKNFFANKVSEASQKFAREEKEKQRANLDPNKRGGVER